MRDFACIDNSQMTAERHSKHLEPGLPGNVYMKAVNTMAMQHHMQAGKLEMALLCFGSTHADVIIISSICPLGRHNMKCMDC